MPKAKKTEKTPTNPQVQPPTVEPAVYTRAHLIVAKADAFDRLLEMEVAMTNKNKAIELVNQINKYVTEYESRNRATPGQTGS